MDVEAILGISLSIKMPGYRLIWSESNNGYFSVCNTYKVAINLHRTINTASASSDSSHRVF